jgi:hypothetical protein
MDELNDMAINDMQTKFQTSTTKLYTDIQQTFQKDDKHERKFLEKHLAINNTILTNLRKLRNLKAAKDE